jgi:uncharacterized BrkB/YihY/UPF0761 family membrane protein
MRISFESFSGVLIAKTTGELNARATVGAGAFSAALGAAWATLNGTWAMIAGLNRAYEIEENRRWWRIVIIAFGLAISLEVMGLITLGAMLYSSFVGTVIGRDTQAGDGAVPAAPTSH